jgi:hypothetical protein
MPNSIPDMLSKAYIRACPHFNSEVAREPGATMDGFLATLSAEEVSVWTALTAIQDYNESLRLERMNELLAKHGNTAVGLELSNPSNGRLMVIFPEPGYRGGFRLCNYDENGPIDHLLFNTAQEAAMDAISHGYQTYAPGQLDKLTDLPSWNRGVKFQALIIKTGGNPWPFLDANPDYLDERAA